MRNSYYALNSCIVAAIRDSESYMLLLSDRSVRACSAKSVLPCHHKKKHAHDQSDESKTRQCHDSWVSPPTQSARCPPLRRYDVMCVAPSVGPLRPHAELALQDQSREMEPPDYCRRERASESKRPCALVCEHELRLTAKRRTSRERKERRGTDRHDRDGQQLTHNLNLNEDGARVADVRASARAAATPPSSSDDASSSMPTSFATTSSASAICGRTEPGPARAE